MKFEEHGVLTDIVYTAINYVKKTFGTSQEVYVVRYFKQAA